MRATLSKDKKYEIAFAALTHHFVGETNGKLNLLKFRPVNDLDLDGFYGKVYITDVNDYKTQLATQKNREKLEMNLLNADSVEELTKANDGSSIVDDYYDQLNEEASKGKGAFESAFNAYRDQVLVLYTTKAQKKLFKAFTKNLTDLNKASILDKGFVNEVVSDLFPQAEWELGAQKTSAKQINNSVALDMDEDLVI